MIFALSNFLAGATGLAIGTILFAGFWPDAAPDTAVVLLAAGGPGEGSPHVKTRGTWIVRALSRSASYATADANANAVYAALHGQSAITLLGKDGAPAFTVGGIEASSMPQTLGMDERRRHLLSTTYLVHGQRL